MGRSISQKLPVILFGEGQSEQGYARWLARLAGTLDIPVAIRAEKLAGGDPFELVSCALGKLTAIERTRGRYMHKALLLDTDLKGQNVARDQQAENTAKQRGLRLIWQSPCHEAFLLRHFGKNETRRPPNYDAAKSSLLREWPDYKKGMDAIGYEKALTLDHLSRARAVEPDLNGFLAAIGWD